MERSQIAGQYARALFETATQQGGQDLADQMFSELETVVDTWTSLPDWEAWAAHPAISIQDKQATLDEALATVHPLLNRLIHTMAAHRRLPLLLELRATYRTLWQQARKHGEVTIESAMPLTPALEAQLQHRLCQTLGLQGLTLHHRVRPDLLGGVVMRYGDQVIDSSLERQLTQIAQVVTI
jgi:F-type H+-transporting ATPase subunit delta